MKDIYGLLNEVNLDSSDIEEVEVSEIERERGKRKLMGSLKKRKNNKKKISVAVASIAIISIVSITVAKPTWAQNIPIIGHLMQNSLINQNGKYSDYMNTIGQTKSQDGIDVTFENAVADKNTFIFSFIVKNNNASIQYAELLANMTMFLNINAKNINMMDGGYQCEVVDKNTIKYLRIVNLEENNIPNYLNVNIDIPEMFDKKGDWGVKFTMNTKDIKKNTYVEKLSNKFKANNIDFGLEEISISPLTTNIKYYAKNDESLWMNFLILDQDDNQVKFVNGESSDKKEKGKIKFSMNYINNANVSSLKLIPEYYNENYIEKERDSKRINLENFSPFEVKLTDKLSIYMENLTVDKGNLIVNYNYKYLGNKIGVSNKVKGFDIKVDGTSVEKETDSDLFEKYETDRIYKIGNAKDIEMEFYDGATNYLLEDDAFTVTKK
ncbi:hypothetical protein psyc5s11_37810 [Clostridium gelidum]|uniref:DUF4179 domain-containing protein n=1 Tax=Clostridium gelidum TaxID=704125 RepID=A0ABN6J510_9CLOT|nr:DUF4179 domain-containing protein [Clostridium gelidum]BCZ47714.1 hypothetical protein psyc5s11_37810 [Clostridium gelidum]